MFSIVALISAGDAFPMRISGCGRDVEERPVFRGAGDTPRELTRFEAFGDGLGMAAENDIPTEGTVKNFVSGEDSANTVGRALIDASCGSTGALAKLEAAVPDASVD